MSKLWPRPPILYWSIASRLGLHLFRAYGLGLPARSFKPSVIMNADARDNPKPIHAVFHSHILRRQTSALGVVFEAVGPGTKRKDITRVMTAGANRAMMKRTVTDTVSPFTGYPMLGSCKENGRLFESLILLKPPPMAAMPLHMN